MSSNLKVLEWRGIIKDVINEEYLKEFSINEENSFYIGIDPTANSLHLGHYITIVLTKLIGQTLKIKPVYVIGGFTGQIGDPSGKSFEREILSKEVVEKNIVAIKKQIEILSKKIGIVDYTIFNNQDIYDELSITDLYKVFGKKFNLNQMLSKEMVKSRLDTGISYTEFSYQLFQAIDFYYLYKTKNVKLKIGGSDQWGNIFSGI